MLGVVNSSVTVIGIKTITNAGKEEVGNFVALLKHAYVIYSDCSRL